MLPQLLEPFGRFRKRGPVTSRYPPQNGMSLGRMSEPLPTALQDLRVGGLIDKLPQGIEIAPDGHVDYDVLAKGAQGCSVSLIGLQKPLKPLRSVRKPIDTLEIGYKIREQR
jgi:hypothetical protein